jgi:hypothetical protein
METCDRKKRLQGCLTSLGRGQGEPICNQISVELSGGFVSQAWLSKSLLELL